MKRFLLLLLPLQAIAQNPSVNVEYRHPSHPDEARMVIESITESPDNVGYWRAVYRPSAEVGASYVNLDGGSRIPIDFKTIEDGGPWEYLVTADYLAGSSWEVTGGGSTIANGVWETIAMPEYHYWTLATDGFWNNTDAAANYHYVISYYGTEGSGEAESKIGATVSVPANHNVQFTGLLHQNFSVHVYRDHAGGTAFVGQYYAKIHTVTSESEVPAEEGVEAILTEGATPPYIPENDFQPQWPESPDFVAADEREDQFGENYDENPVPNPEATDTDVVAAIDRHDNNRREEHLTDENTWKQSEENQNKRFDDLNEAQEDRQDEIVAWLAQNGAQNSAGHAATKNAIDELNSALTSGVEGAEDPGPVDIESNTDGQDDSLFESMSEDIQGTVNRIMGLVPDPQTLPTVSGRNYTYNLSFASYKGADFSFEMDLNPYKSVIELIRALEAGLVVIMFLVSAIKTVRGGFA